MPSWVVPHSIFPDGYHVDPQLPLPFLSIASQKRHIGFYHMGIYASPELLEWFTQEYPNHCKTKLDMGKSCIRFKNPSKIPYELIGELCSKMSVQEWISLYQKQYHWLFWYMGPLGIDGYNEGTQVDTFTAKFFSSHITQILTWKENRSSYLQSPFTWYISVLNSW